MICGPPFGPKLLWRPAHGHACDVASPTENPIAEVSVDDKDSQTTEETRGGDMVDEDVMEFSKVSKSGVLWPMNLVALHARKSAIRISRVGPFWHIAAMKYEPPSCNNTYTKEVFGLAGIRRI